MTAPLDYAPQPAVGDVTLDRGPDGATIVTVRSSWRRVATALFPSAMVAGSVLTVFAIDAALTSNRSRHAVDIAEVALVAGLAVLVGLGACVQPLSRAMYPIRWEVSPHGIGVTFRRPTQVVHESYAGGDIADVRVERIKLKNQLRKRPGLVAVNPFGQRLVHRYGPRRELEFMAKAFRNGLGIGHDPLGESGFPRPGPWWQSVTRQIGRANVAVTLRPMRLPGDGLAVALVAVVAGIATAGVLRWYALAAWGTSAGFASLVGVAAAMTGIGVVTAVHRLRRTVTIAVDAARVTLVEQTLIRPGREQWPTARVTGVRMSARGRRGNLLLDLIDGTTVSLLTNQPIRAVRAMHDTLVVGLARVGVRSACILPL